jgi:tRNA (guanine37-N1)-methyltransferase
MAKPKIQFDVLTLFPDIIYDYGSESILKRAQKAGLIKIKAHNFRDFTKDKQRHVDDRPYGGGAGMVLQIQPIYDTLQAMKLVKDGKKLKIKNLKILLMDPVGKKFDQRMAEKFSKLDRLIFICGRYEGFDERIYKLADEKISVGDYVLSGGELPALTIVEAVSRLIPGVLGNEESLIGETHGQLFKNSKLKNPKFEIENLKFEIPGRYPAYTRPENFMGMKVPKVLLSGDHKKIGEWRKKQLK